MKQLSFLVTIIIFITSCSNKSTPVQNTTTLPKETSQTELVTTEKIFNYTEYFIDTNANQNDLIGYETLDINNIDKTEFAYKKVEGKYINDWFSIVVPKEMYVLNEKLTNGVMLKFKNRDMFYYIFSPQWTLPNIYLRFDFNFEKFRSVKGKKIKKIVIDENSISGEYFFPQTKDGYIRNVSFYKSLSGGGMSIFVLIYNYKENLEDILPIIKIVDDSFVKYAD